MRHLAFIAIVAAIAGCLCPSASTAQETRPLTAWVDSVRLNVCGPKTFQAAIRVASFRPSDTVVGFRSSDNVASATLYVTWDPSTLDIDQLVITSGTMSQGIDVRPRKFSEESTLEIVIADNEAPFGFLRGALPVIYINGTVKAPDTVAWPNGWIQVTDVELTSDTRFEPESYRPGYVRVERDTTAAYSGAIRAGAASFDTLKLDTLTLSLENVRARRVREVSFSIAVDTSFIVLVDTLQTGTLADQPLWTTVELVRAADTIRGRFVAASDLSQEGPLLKFLIRRTTDSAFTTDVSVTEVGINGNSCLGRFRGFGAPVTASAIETPMSAPVNDELASEITVTPLGEGRAVLVRSGDITMDGADVFDALGRRVAAQLRWNGERELRIQIEGSLTGPYFVQLRIGNARIGKQFIVIQ